MFTGLIEATGTIESVRPDGSGRRVRVAAALASELRPGDSIAVNGVCLTAVEIGQKPAPGVGVFDVDISPATLRVTTLDELVKGRTVNLERPLRADARLGGHFVLGHVDGVGRITAFDRDGDCYWLSVEVPDDLLRYVIPKGSVAIDGISLTIARLDPHVIGMQIIPFTWQHTALAHAATGDRVNLEVDVLGKYVERLLSSRSDAGAPIAGLAGRT
jgi:riboflavin synthase